MERGLECGGKRPWGSALAVNLGFATFLLCVSGQLPDSLSSSKNWKSRVLYNGTLLYAGYGACPVSAQPPATVIIV